VIVVAGLTLAGYRLHLNSAATGFLYLIAVVLNCLDSGMIPATIVSVVAVGCLDFFFIQPVWHFTVADPVDAAALAAFLITSLVVTRLASKAREQAKTAARKSSNLGDLYELAQSLLGLDPIPAGHNRMLDSIRRVFRLKAVCIFDVESAELSVSGDPSSNLGEKTREAYIVGTDIDDGAAHIAVRCLRVSSKIAGALGFEGLREQAQMADPIAALTSVGLERSRAVRAASEAAAAAQTETLRAAILDAIAHEFKTPLATILTAAGGLEAAGALTPEQSELAGLVESEAARLSRLSSRLLRLVRLDSEEVKPRLKPFHLEAGLASLVDRYSDQYPDRSFSITNRGEPADALADAELFELAVGQLFDNACRYSPPGSPIEIGLQFEKDTATVFVWNGGPAVTGAEATRIFERFYGGAEARRLGSGTGLGLYVARKIALAHGGRLELDFASSERGGVTFRFTIPLSREGSRSDEHAPASLNR
jgi:two-component system sensor histidine kinase KdpD